MFKRILVANRGEIALRVMRTAKEMGIETVAVYSDFDRDSLHARLADEAVCLGGAVPAASYLDMEKVLYAARETGAEAIHPGYGFLAENAEFARRVEAAGMVWIGPPPTAIESMGDKIESRRLMGAAGVQCVPGLQDPVDDAVAAVVAAEGIGYPVAIKAAAGGGGKGIRIVHDPEKMEAAFFAASGEAVAAFGDGRLYLERYIEHPRHVEIQVLFDGQGNGTSLGERDCTVQRRHQKLIEEAPSPVVSAEIREQMGEVAVAAGKAVGYVGAGTVEFLYDDTSGTPEFFFLEMNTRLQVEHPVTELVLGVDLVRMQLEIAAGGDLGVTARDLVPRGHAIEVRINAEDPTNGFVPSTGTIGNLRWPGGPWVRIDSGLYRGMEVGLDYDPMLAKIIVWAQNRDEAIVRMRRALEELNIGGVRTGAPAALAVLEDERFVEGHFDTHLIETVDLSGGSAERARAAALAAVLHRFTAANRRALAGRSDDRAAWLARDRGADSRWSADSRSYTRGGNS